MISDLGKNIQRIRQGKGLSANKLAHLANVGNSTISQIENGIRQTLQMNTTQRIADALGVSVNELIGNEDTSKFETNDIEDILNIINYADFITFENKPFTREEKVLVETAVKMALDAIRYNRTK